MVKNFDLDLENAALGLGQYFQYLGHSFSPFGPPSHYHIYTIRLLPYNEDLVANLVKR